MAAPYDGGCACGAVRYRVTQEPLTLYACHCTDCQRHSGASFQLSMITLKDTVELLRGTPQSYAITTPEGLQRHGTFCGTCATRLWGEPVKFPQLAVIRPGTLDDTSWIQPIGHIWTRSAQPWVPIPDGPLKFETQPDDFMILVNAWQVRQQ